MLREEEKKMKMKIEGYDITTISMWKIHEKVNRFDFEIKMDTEKKRHINKYPQKF